ncbi:hypothetical protein [Jeotgalibacillus proteolyticus]|uniref:Uncharacterized protein n=1 Tax=Jeotgalibacillus proteolyticus TaxID=2082395 RepID=A0A2S5G9E4_9BACL|nr:hypothetical protein [Jeotgalibacillus proteolyticus]PPA69543.1 hypothetical protein C4B60_13425 [Jeotgalibacillus proteolyticus]
MSEFHPEKENFALVRTDSVSFIRNSTVYTYTVQDVHSFEKLMSELVYGEILIGFEGKKNAGIEKEAKGPTESIEITPLNRSRTYTEMVFRKEELNRDVDFIHTLYVLAEVNEFVFIVLDPIRNKQYYDAGSGKLKVCAEGKNETIIWFEYDAKQLYFVKNEGVQ